MTQENQEKIRRFEWKIIRRIYYAIQVIEEKGPIQTNRVIREILKGKYIVQRVEEGRMPKKILHAKVYATRRRGKLRL